jgi:hypothetical protein
MRRLTDALYNCYEFWSFERCKIEVSKIRRIGERVDRLTGKDQPPFVDFNQAHSQGRSEMRRRQRPLEQLIEDFPAGEGSNLLARQRTDVLRFKPRHVFMLFELFHFCLLPDASVSKMRLSCADQV